MRQIATCLLCLCTTVWGQTIAHRFVCIDNNREQARLIYVDQTAPAKSWSVPLPDVAGRPGVGQYRDLQLLDGGRVLVNHVDGAGEYDLASGRLVRCVVTGLAGIHTARRLGNGHTLLAGQKFLYECDAEGALLRRVGLPAKPRPSVRVIRVTAQGTILFAGLNPTCVVEMDMDAKVIRTVPLPGGKGYKHERLPNGNLLCSTGSLCKVVELEPTGKVVLSVGGKKDHPDASLDFCSGWSRLSNGNIVMANWLGHGKAGTGPHLVEFTRENRIVWEWEDHDVAESVTNVLVIE